MKICQRTKCLVKWGQWGCTKLVSMCKLCLCVVEKKKIIFCDWKKVPQMSLKELSFWHHNPRLAECLAGGLKVIDGLKQLLSLFRLKVVLNGFTGVTVLIPGGQQQEYVLGMPCYFCKNLQFAWDCLSGDWHTSFIRAFLLDTCFQSWWVSNLVCCKRILSNR